MAWTGPIISGWQGIARLAVMRLWTTKGDSAQKLGEQEEEGLAVLLRRS